MSMEIKSPKRNYPALLIVGSLLALALCVFALQNAETVEVRFFSLDAFVPKALLIFITLALGVIIGVLFSLPSILKHRSNSKKLNKALKVLESKPTEAPPQVEKAATKKPDIKT